MVLALCHQAGALGEKGCIAIEGGFEVGMVDVPLCAVVQYDRDPSIR